MKSAKVNDVMAGDDETDCASDIWSGAFPLHVAQGPVVHDPKLASHVVMPDFARNFRYDWLGAATASMSNAGVMDAPRIPTLD